MGEYVEERDTSKSGISNYVILINMECIKYSLPEICYILAGLKTMQFYNLMTLENINTSIFKFFWER